MRRQNLSLDHLALFLIALSFATHLWWMFYTHYTEEDAFITFRYAEQIARGNGFVYNIGEPVYGTTTPLFTILLALWLKFVSNDVVPGANILNLLTAIAIPIFTWKTLKFLNRSGAEQIFVLSVLLFSSKLIYINTNGMEISPSISLLAGSWYTWVKGKTKLTGLLCGLLLWTRIDNVFWVVVLACFTLVSSRKKALDLGVVAGITYLPWVIFATLYFGSPIPHTIIAKWVNYSRLNETSYFIHLGIILKYLSPFGTQTVLQWTGTTIALCAACWGLWINGTLREKAFHLLMAFLVFEILRLTLTRATFFTRYFTSILWLSLVLFGVGLGACWERIRAFPISRYVFLFLFASFVVVRVAAGISFAQTVREAQTFRHESSLKAMGIWLRNNTSPRSTILLEPLGYVGYFSERVMIEEVGLVTPSVTKLKLQQIGNEKYVSIFRPDYTIVHCDDEIRIPRSPETGPAYKLVKTFNPLGFYPGMPDPDYVVWASCYQIWEKDG